MKQSSSKRIKTSLKTLLIIFLVVAVIIITYSIIELNESKKELTLLMEKESHSLLESMLAASNNALLSYEVIDTEMKTRLLNNANIVKLMFEKRQISNSFLKQLAEENNLNRINIFNQNGNKTFSSHTSIHTDLEENFSPKNSLYPIFNNETDTLFLGTKEARFQDGYRYAVAIATDNNGAIVINLDAEEYLRFRKSIGFGALLKTVTENKGIVYAVLQDTNGIIAASGELQNITSILGDSFLQKALLNSIFNTRIVSEDTLNIFEAVHPFSYKGKQIGLLRLGLSAEPLFNISNANNKRVLILSLVLLLLGSALLAYIFSKQNFDLLKKDYKIIEDYSHKILQNVSDSVIVIDSNNIINAINKAAINLFNTVDKDILGKDISEIIPTSIVKEIVNNQNPLFPFISEINKEIKHLLISKSSFENDEEQVNTTLVIRDLTRQKKIEEQLNRKDKLVAMGELASGVAHEIRNPLNTISTIAQQLKKDFEPKNNTEEFQTLTGLVNKEILRINDTIKDFLRFAKPEQINQNKFILSDLINQLEIQYSAMFGEKNILFTKTINWDGQVNWDRKQIQQSLMNLLQNSYDAIESKGEISLTISEHKKDILMEVKDSGEGIPKNHQNKIFNLYYTSKASGTGIGLSLVQKIIFEHNGIIDLSSKETEGTTFIIRIPQNPKLN